ncbi:hypothetical protein SpCBS45565_g07751 [Spizellomyces sp. 'palustris']|nr:hypothetical protein SpCBS45565_g07751 [Spizellomyces sp. 'palustris']
MEPSFLSELRSIPIKSVVSISLYFLTFGACLTIALSRALRSLPYTISAWLYTPIALASLYITWTEIFKFIENDYQTFGGNSTLTDYLTESDWFDAAYVAVTRNPDGWWWSVQLLNIAAVIVALIWSEGVHHWARKTVKGGPGLIRAGLGSALAYVLLGFLGAMSVCFAFFLVQRSVIEKTYVLKSSPRLTPSVFVLFGLYILGVAYTPYIEPSSVLFGVNLKLLHLALLLPVLGAAGPVLIHRPKTITSTTNLSSQKGIESLYTFLTVANLISCGFATYQRWQDWSGLSVPEILQRLADAVYDNPCQVSITADLAFSGLLAVLFLSGEVRKGVKAGLVAPLHGFLVVFGGMVASPIVGIAVVLPAFLAWREGWVRKEVGAKSKAG